MNNAPRFTEANCAEQIIIILDALDLGRRFKNIAPLACAMYPDFTILPNHNIVFYDGSYVEPSKNGYYIAKTTAPTLFIEK